MFSFARLSLLGGGTKGEGWTLYLRALPVNHDKKSESGDLNSHCGSAVIWT
jgi:hypothetical protein